MDKTAHALYESGCFILLSHNNERKEQRITSTVDIVGKIKNDILGDNSALPPFHR